MRVLNARGVAFKRNDLLATLPRLAALEDLELEKPYFDDAELAVICTSLPLLTRLVLAGGAVGSQAHAAHQAWGPGPPTDWAAVSHARLQHLVLEGGRCAR